MKKILLILCMVLGGCTTAREGSGIINQGRDEGLSHAVRLYDEGKEQEAEKRLREVVAQKPAAGVTDEALFRLGLLQLKSGIVREDLEQAQSRLETLQRDYPSSPWARLAAPLLAVIKEAQRQNREIRILAKENRELAGLKGQNISLIKENKELKKTIERLKHLDMELEKKPRRR